MPWKECAPMDEKLLFIADHLRGGVPLSELCRRCGISCKTACKWVERYRQLGMDGLQERSRRPHGNNQAISHAQRRAIIELRDQRFLGLLAQDAVYLAGMSLAKSRVALGQRVAQHLLQWNTLVAEHGMACRHRHHRFVFPCGLDQNAVACVLGHGETGVVQVVMQALDLLGQGHIEQADLDFGVFFAATGQQGRQARGVVPSDSAMRNCP